MSQNLTPSAGEHGWDEPIEGGGRMLSLRVADLSVSRCSACGNDCSVGHRYCRLDSFSSPFDFVPCPFMYEVCYCRVDVAYDREPECYVYPSSKEVDHGNIQYNDYCSISKCLKQGTFRCSMYITHRLSSKPSSFSHFECLAWTRIVQTGSGSSPLPVVP